MAGRNPNARSRDMFISMAVLVLPVLLVVWLFSQEGDVRPEPVDVASVVERAQTQSPYPVLYAQDLGDGWQPVRATWAASGDPFVTSEPAVGNSWQVGYLSPREVYFEVLQRDSQGDTLIADATREGARIGEGVDLAGLSWERYESGDGRTRSLVSTDGDVTSVVSADTDFAELEAFTSALVEAPPQG
ncbi:DUF4245 domain-containing protein [Tessaracoccus flavus]|uniref:DUF4245 domain-containing protein n=1 Tax=Tessaracoccus flavus TaxID=1610493 RepID=A0A1Q2CGD4_9ACTN|nr:DUF4245 domain-containing protein [Tessaracoccus flavus]AQP45178.1 hypothetical protein RPIT_10530 [Tessaracoccus flavus]